jgi:hypothetical protein
MAAQVYTPERTRMYFKSLFERGHLASRHDQYINENIRYPRNSSDSFYGKILAEQGQEAAEAALAKWATATRMSDYASLIEPVARGMMAMASVDKGIESEYVRLIDITRDTPFPHHYLLNQGKMAVLVNRGAPGCGCMQPDDSEIFSPYGRIGIKAVVLSRDSSNPTATELGVVLPIRGYDNVDTELRRSGFTVVKIDLAGHIDATTLLPHRPDPDYLMKSLGLVNGQFSRGMEASGGHFDDAVGFPGATDYLAVTLPRLEQYFTDLAEKLSTKHKH